MYPGSLPLILNGSVPGYEKFLCSMYAGVQYTQVFNLTGSTVFIDIYYFQILKMLY